MRGKKSNLTQNRKHNNSLSDLSNMRQTRAEQNKQIVSEALALEREKAPFLPIPNWQDQRINHGFKQYLKIMSAKPERYPSAKYDAETIEIVKQFLAGYYQGEVFAESEFKLAYRLYDALAVVEAHRIENDIQNAVQNKGISSATPSGQLPEVMDYRTYQNAGQYLVPKEFRVWMDEYMDLVKDEKSKSGRACDLINRLEAYGFNRANCKFFAYADGEIEAREMLKSL